MDSSQNNTIPPLDIFANISKTIQPVDVKSRVTIKNFPVDPSPEYTKVETPANTTPIPLSHSESKLEKFDDSMLVERLNIIHKDVFDIKDALLSHLESIPSDSKQPSSGCPPKSSGVFIIPNLVNYNFKFLKFHLDGNLCVLVVDPSDFNLEIAPGTEVIINLPGETEGDSTSFNLRVLSSAISLDIGDTVYSILIFYIPSERSSTD